MSQINEAKRVLTELTDAIQQKLLDQAQTTLNKAKILLTQLPGLTAPTADASAVEQREIARGILEQAVILSALKDDRPTFQRHMTQLKLYYFDYSSQLAESPLRYTILGLNLLYLLTENRLAEFHSELELLSDAGCSNPNVQFVTRLEEDLMMGSYGKVLTASVNSPNPCFTAFLSSLMDTVREAIADCAEVAYDSWTLAAAQERLMFKSPSEVEAYVQETHPEWNIMGDLITFSGAETVKKSSQIPSLQLISETLSYATELERIV
mmetsp:Transcript_34397/g.45492  ORF Transcript_34397/g.45492 Transcript_34397/m.45492 type:complete len:266 (-) Transcript_34397:475-1272(-)